MELKEIIEQHVGNGVILPKGAVFLFRLLIAQAVEPFVLRWVGNALVVEHPGDSRLAVALRKESEYLADDSGGLLVNDKMPLLLRVLLIAIECEGSDVKAVLSSVDEDTADVGSLM